MVVVYDTQLKTALRMDSKSKRAVYPDFSRNAEFFE